MKFLSKLKPKAKISNSSPSMLVAGVLTFFVVMTVLTIVSGLFLGRQARVESALLSAQRLEYDFVEEKMYGTIRTTEDSDKKTASSKTDGKKQGEENSGDEIDFSWLDDDFIGPRMPQTYIDMLMESFAENIKVEKVKLSELSDKPVIVVILKGLGLSASTTKLAMDLPASVNFGLSPYSSSIEDWAKTAKEQGREIILNLPMETKDYRLNDPGPYALLTQSSKEDNITRLNMLLGLVKGYEAVYSEREEIFTHTLSSSMPILKELKKKRKYMLFGGGYADFSLVQMANELDYPLLVNDFVLDDDISIDTINKKFKKIEETATEKGYVVVMAHPYPITIRMLDRWLPEVEERGYNIAPVSLLLGKHIIKD